VRFCPNYDCPYRQLHDHAAEYGDEAEKCSDCGATLTGTSAATVKEAQDLGAPVAEPLVLPPSPFTLLGPLFLIAAGIGMCFSRFMRLYYSGGAIVMGVMTLRQRRRNTPRILPHEHGFVVVVGDERIPYPAARLEHVRVDARQLRFLGVPLGTFHDLTLTAAGRTRTFSGFGQAPFVDFARSLQARSTLR
jgi:hypothetical protein